MGLYVPPAATVPKENEAVCKYKARATVIQWKLKFKKRPLKFVSSIIILIQAVKAVSHFAQYH